MRRAAESRCARKSTRAAWEKVIVILAPTALARSSAARKRELKHVTWAAARSILGGAMTFV